MPTESELAQYYSEGYYAYQPILKPTRLTKLKQKILRSPIPNHDPDFSEPGDFLDIGCGSGTYLERMRSRGWNVRGVEPSAHGVANGRQAGFDIFHGTLVQASFPSDSFDYVRSNHSFEHMPNPVQVLGELYRIVRSGGKVYVGVPNIDSLPFRLFRRYWWYMGAPVHTYSYSVKTLTALLQRAGFLIRGVHYNSNYTSLLGSLQIYVNRNTTKRSEQGWLFSNLLLIITANLLERIIDLVHQGDAIEVICEKVNP
ncbi:class I SAM-dependent methyltransferase [Alloacidobacterium dinghuense]|uniref:Class I SAM-dependent methyltransferase n=1 Tax=Alloacidobacterium dinghuense TaxID=2763107 RepID=A0A7G8BGA9_9BACT|nr:class I SAM-dependent methyltransferase [Alloacidobacterium dinghuense]